MDSLPPSSPLKPTHSSGWAAWLLPQDAKRRLRTEQTAVAGLFSIASIGFLQYAGWAGYASLLVVQLWSLVTLGGSVGFFLAIRSGWSERLKVPSLTIAQMAYAISACAMAYMHTGPVRGALVTLLMVVMMFGMFALSTRKVLAVGLFALAMFALAMTVSAYRHPQVAPAAVEWGHFIMLAMAMPAVAVLAERLKRLRRRMQDQKRELRQALDEIHQMATHDSLTGLMNRRCLDDLLDKEIRRSARSGARLCLALIDLDHFKRINDQHGHACGDEVLRVFARDVGQKVRITDALGRWGGEEFVLLMPDVDLPRARAGAERLRRELEQLAIVHGTSTIHVTLSAGVVELQDGEAAEALVNRADQALYEAKSRGRNTVLAR